MATMASVTLCPDASVDAMRGAARRRDCRQTDGSWIATISAPPTATPTAAERTPHCPPSTNIAVMMPAL